MYSNKLLILNLVLLSCALSATGSDSEASGQASARSELHRPSHSRRHGSKDNIKQSFADGASIAISPSKARAGASRPTSLSGRPQVSSKLSLSHEEIKTIQQAAIGQFMKEQLEVEKLRLNAELSRSKLQTVGVFGAGFLAGAALVGGIWALKQNPEGAAGLRSLFSSKKV